MPSYWSNKDERKYKHIKDSARERGTSTDRAEEIAARTVNKQRQAEGRTGNSRPSGTGNPHTRLEARTRNELYNRARELKIAGRSTMNKTELAAAIGRQ
jgi:plasmid stabilization system protein ParE